MSVRWIDDIKLILRHWLRLLLRKLVATVYDCLHFCIGLDLVVLFYDCLGFVLFLVFGNNYVSLYFLIEHVGFFWFLASRKLNLFCLHEVGILLFRHCTIIDLQSIVAIKIICLFVLDWPIHVVFLRPDLRVLYWSVLQHFNILIIFLLLIERFISFEDKWCKIMVIHVGGLAMDDTQIRFFKFLNWIEYFLQTLLLFLRNALFSRVVQLTQLFVSWCRLLILLLLFMLFETDCVT